MEGREIEDKPIITWKTRLVQLLVVVALVAGSFVALASTSTGSSLMKRSSTMNNLRVAMFAKTDVDCTGNPDDDGCTDPTNTKANTKAEQDSSSKKTKKTKNADGEDDADVDCTGNPDDDGCKDPTGTKYNSKTAKDSSSKKSNKKSSKKSAKRKNGGREDREGRREKNGKKSGSSSSSDSESESDSESGCSD